MSHYKLDALLTKSEHPYLPDSRERYYRSLSRRLDEEQLNTLWTVVLCNLLVKINCYLILIFEKLLLDFLIVTSSSAK